MFRSRKSRQLLINVLKHGTLSFVLIAAVVMTFGFHVFQQYVTVAGLVAAGLWIIWAAGGIFYLAVYGVEFFTEVVPGWVSAGSTVEPMSRKQRKLERQLQIEQARARGIEEARLAAIKANTDENGEPKQIALEEAKPGIYPQYDPLATTPAPDPVEVPRQRRTPFNPNLPPSQRFTLMPGTRHS